MRICSRNASTARSVSGASAIPLGVFEPGIHQLLLYPEPGFSDDPDDVSQVFRRLEFDPLLLRPTNVVRPKQPLHLNRKLHTRTGVCRKQLLPNCDIHHTAKNSQFPMNRRGLKAAFLDDTGSGLDLDTGLESAPKVILDIICADIANRTLAKTPS